MYEFTCSAMSVDIFFFFNDTATTEIYTLSLHDALPIYKIPLAKQPRAGDDQEKPHAFAERQRRSEEHTSELQSQSNLVCRLLLEIKKSSTRITPPPHRSHNVVGPLSYAS